MSDRAVLTDCPVFCYRAVMAIDRRSHQGERRDYAILSGLANRAGAIRLAGCTARCYRSHHILPPGDVARQMSFSVFLVVDRDLDDQHDQTASIVGGLLRVRCRCGASVNFCVGGLQQYRLASR